MSFIVGQKVSYPNHGVCAIESVDSKQINGSSVDFYLLRVLSNNSVIFVPKLNAESVGIRPIINHGQCSQLIDILSEDFTETPNDWKIRVRDYSAMIQTGDIFEVVEVLKQLTFLTHSKQLSFREQRLFEKARFLVVSEIAIAWAKLEFEIEKKVDASLAQACQKHLAEKVQVASFAI